MGSRRQGRLRRPGERVLDRGELGLALNGQLWPTYLQEKGPHRLDRAGLLSLPVHPRSGNTREPLSCGVDRAYQWTPRLSMTT
jgi:hypothetical protein